MAKTTTKRKSESVVPPSKNKLRKMSTSNRHGASDSEDHEYQTDNGLFVKDQPVATTKYVKTVSAKSRKSEPVQTREDEYDDDPGRVESQDFLSLFEAETKKKKKAAMKESGQHMEKFAKDVDRDKRILKKQVEDLISTSGRTDADFLRAFRTAYRAATPCPPPTSASKGSLEHPSFASMYKKSKVLADGALQLAAKFDQVNKRVMDVDKTSLINNNWGEEDEKVAHLITVGRDLGLEKSGGALTTSKGTAMDSADAEKGEMLFDEKRKAHSTWSRIARKEEKATRKLIKAYSMDFA